MAAAALVASGCQKASQGPVTADQVLSRMSQTQKIQLVHGEQESAATFQGQAGYLAGDPQLGIPSLRFADGPPGVLTKNPSTAPTATMGLAATFSPQDAQQNGVVIGRDARALGIDVALQPFINIYRDPTWGRAYNIYGEDPLLTGEIGAGVVRGIQSQGTMSQAKHYIAYDGGNNVIVGQQALHEIYAEPFAYVVRAGVSSIMCSYNQVNGAYACGNSDTLRTLLKQELGFKGFVTSDWGATHATNFIAHGLDMEMPGARTASNGNAAFRMSCFFCATEPAPQPAAASTAGQTRGGRAARGGRGAAAAFGRGRIPEEPALSFGGRGGPGRGQAAPPQGMLAALKAGDVTMADINGAVSRILYEMHSFGWLGGTGPKHNVTAVPFDEDVKIVEKTAEDAAVLLKNENHALPLTSSDLQSLALIGPGAGQTITIGESGEKALGFPSRDISPLAALRQATSNVTGRHITFAVADDMTGSPIPAARLSHDGHPGLQRENAQNQATGVDATLNFTNKNGHALPAGTSASWRGTLNIPTTGDYWLYLQQLGGYVRLSVDGQQVASNGFQTMHGNYIQPNQDNVLPTTDNLDNLRVAVHLTAGNHALLVNEEGDTSGKPVQIRLNWLTPQQRRADFQAAVNAARRARTAVVFAWGRGRPAYGLPGDQDQLIEQVARVNPRTIVVLNTSQPDALPWLGQVKAVLEMWYPGDGGGVATANVLLGHSDPAGRLPFTWAQRLNQYVSHDPAHPERTSAGVNGVTHYSEGIFVGYRWFDEQKIKPVFPFGFGLSYTQFRYSDLHVTRATDGELTVNFTVQNTGHVAGDEVPQVYLGAPTPEPQGAQFAVRALAGFDRISLAPGQSSQVTIQVPLRQLQYWADAANAWKLAAGSRVVYVGSSSGDLPLQQSFTVAAGTGQ